MTLDETRRLLAATGGPDLSHTAVWRATEAVGWGRKKSIPAAERDTEHVVGLRKAFVKAIQDEDFTRFVFVNETSTNIDYSAPCLAVQPQIAAADVQAVCTGSVYQAAVALPRSGPTKTRV